MLPLHHDPGFSDHRGMRLNRADMPIASIRSNHCLTNVIESGRPDLNRRSQAPRACGLARLSHALDGTGSAAGAVNGFARRSLAVK
jgi:hypothetical protein